MTPADLLAWQSRCGYSKAAAAKALGVSYPGYRHWLDGEREIPPWVPILCRYIERYGPLEAA